MDGQICRGDGYMTILKAYIIMLILFHAILVAVFFIFGTIALIERYL